MIVDKLFGPAMKTFSNFYDFYESMKNYERFPRKQSKQCRCQFLNVKIFIPKNWTQAAGGLQAKQESERYESNMLNEIYVFVFLEINQLLITVNDD